MNSYFHHCIFASERKGRAKKSLHRMWYGLAQPYHNNFFQNFLLTLVWAAHMTHTLHCKAEGLSLLLL